MTGVYYRYVLSNSTLSYFESVSHKTHNRKKTEGYHTSVPLCHAVSFTLLVLFTSWTWVSPVAFISAEVCSGPEVVSGIESLTSPFVCDLGALKTLLFALCPWLLSSIDSQSPACSS